MNGNELKERRKKLGLSQESLAEHWKVPQATISRWESGKHPIQHAEILDEALKNLEKEYGKHKRLNR